MDLVVPDASVILKWALPSGEERDADRALVLRDAIASDAVRAIVPSLWLQEAPVTSKWLTTVVELTSRYGASFYDAAYHAPALVNGGVFVTVDERYARVAAPHGAVVTLGEWEPGNGRPGSRTHPAQ